VTSQGEEIYDDKLAYLEEKFPGLNSVPFELKVLAGSEPDLANELAKYLGADLIRIGTSGASGIDEIFGTVAEKVSRVASCPILVIPDAFDFVPPK
jgi:nucleotide-binding universal stress UspA family protein